MSSINEGGDAPACANTWKVKWKVLIQTEIKQVEETKCGNGHPNWEAKVRNHQCVDM